MESDPIDSERSAGIAMMRQTSAVLSIAVGSIGIVSSALRGQTATLIPDEVSCAKCSIMAHRLVTLQPGDGPAVIDRLPFSVRVDGRSRYWVVSERQLPMVFGPDGRFLKQVGRMGRGPGEFEWPFDVLPISSDSVLVLDPGARRTTVIRPDLTPGRTINLVAQIREPALVRWPDAVVMSGSIYTDGGKDYPLHRVSFARNEAQVTRQFGTETYNLNQFEMSQMFKHLTPSKAGVWSSDQLEYRFASWTKDGTLIHLFERRPPWFPQRSAGWLGSPTTAPPPTVSDIAEDESGLLWTFVRVAASTWREGWPARKPGQREVAMKDIQHDRMFGTIIEVIDPLAKRVVARHSMKEYVFAALPGRRAAVYGSTVDGEPFISIVSFSLSGR
jgi:hypothetical protein